MSIVVKELKNNNKVLFDTGRFDDWCVYIIYPNGSRKAPYDVQYFSDFQHIAAKYTDSKVHDDFVSIYNRTTTQIDPLVLELINQICETYLTEHQLIIEQWFTVVYAGMIAEENKKKAILKKRIKRLGMYQLLILQYSPLQAATFSKGKNWRELDKLMKSHGF